MAVRGGSGNAAALQTKTYIMAAALFQSECIADACPVGEESRAILVPKVPSSGRHQDACSNHRRCHHACDRKIDVSTALHCGEVDRTGVISTVEPPVGPGLVTSCPTRVTSARTRASSSAWRGSASLERVRARPVTVKVDMGTYQVPRNHHNHQSTVQH
jgi:hypothetical protein